MLRTIALLPNNLGSSRRAILPQMLLNLVTTLLAATPALAQLQTQLQQVSSSAPATAPAPFQHWTPKLNPPGNVKASAEPVGIEGVAEEDEDEENLARCVSVFNLNKENVLS